MRSSVSSLSLSAAVAVSLAGSVGAGDALAQDAVTLAFLGPLTGGNSAAGIGGRNSAELAIKLRNADPDTKYEYKLEPLDTECRPSVGVQAATRVATNPDIIAGVTHYCSTVGIATAEVYHRFGLPVVVWGAILPDITYGNDYKEIHRVNGTMYDENREAAEFLTGLGYQRWAGIYDTTDYGRGQLDIFQDELQEAGGEMLGTFGVSPDAQDVSAELLSARELEPQILFFGGLTPLGVRVRAQMDRQGLDDVQFQGVSGTMSVSFLDALGETAEGSLAFHNGAPIETHPGGRMFLEEYEAEGYTDPPEPYGPYAFVAASLIMDAIEKVGPNRELVMEELNGTNEKETIVGPITFDDHGQHSVEATKYVAQDGEWVRWEDSEYADGTRALRGLD